MNRSRVLAALNARIEAVDAFAAKKRAQGITVAGDRAVGRAEGLREARDLLQLEGASSAPPALTPEVVLRAMLAAYERAALEAETAYRRGDVDAFASHSEIADAAKYIRSTTALYLIFGSLDIREPEILADYKARLAGTRPLGAPPLATK